MRWRRATAILGAILALSLAACGSTAAPSDQTIAPNPTSAASSPSPTRAASSPSPSATRSAAPKYGIGDTLVNGGVTLTLNEAFDAPSITVNETSYRRGSGYETYTERMPTEGGKFFVARTTIENTGKRSMDLTCGYPIAIKALSDKDQEFDQADDLSDVQDNPLCNDNLQPGFSTSVTYAFVVPADANIVGLYFYDTSGSERGNPAIFTLDPNYTITFG